jgi:hypothetical protein
MSDRKYTAPALEKGLDILDLLAGHGQAMTLSQISVALEKSVGEIFRMIHVLEFKGFIETAPGAEGYELTKPAVPPRHGPRAGQDASGGGASTDARTGHPGRAILPPRPGVT